MLHDDAFYIIFWKHAMFLFNFILFKFCHLKLVPCSVMECCRMLLLGLSTLSQRLLNSKKLQEMGLESLMHP